jgi:hypothetical protein
VLLRGGEALEGAGGVRPVDVAEGDDVLARSWSRSDAPWPATPMPAMASFSLGGGAPPRPRTWAGTTITARGKGGAPEELAPRDAVALRRVRSWS